MSRTDAHPILAAPENLTDEPSSGHWRAAGWLAAGHVVVALGAIALQAAPLFQEGADGVQRSYVDGDLATQMAGGMLAALSFILLVPVLVFLTRVIGRGTQTGEWAAQTAIVGGAGYVVSAVAVGLPAGAAALYGAQNGMAVETALALNNVRTFAYFLSWSLLAVHAIGLAVAARQGRVMRRWIGWGGLVVGVLLLLSIPAVAVGQQDWGHLAWLVWWIGITVGLLRHRGAAHA